MRQTWILMLLAGVIAACGAAETTDDTTAADTDFGAAAPSADDVADRNDQLAEVEPETVESVDVEPAAANREPAPKTDAEANQIFRALDAASPFLPPIDRTLSEAQLDAVFAVTDEVWTRIIPWFAAIDAVEQEAEERGDDVERLGMEAQGAAFLHTRIELASALQRHGMSPGEYMWAGVEILRAYDTQNEGTSYPGLPEQNLALAREHRDRIAPLEHDRAGSFKKRYILVVAVSWGTQFGITQRIWPEKPLGERPSTGS